MTMFKILIHVANAMPAILDYKTREKAEDAYLNIQNVMNGAIDVRCLKQKDDFGIEVTMPMEKINYVIFVDVFKQQEIQAMQGTVNAKAH
jgi:hypothetical protein